MTVDRHSVTEMAKFMAALDGKTAIGSQSDSSVTSEVDAKKDMKTILERFYRATDHVISEATNDHPLREAIITEETPERVRIGNWEIVVHGSDKRKLYDVVRTGTQERLANDLTLFEAAHGLVRHLNNGGRINQPAILDLLSEEQRYAGAIHDMALFRHRLNQQPNGQRAIVHEARYTAAQRSAVTARTQVRKLVEAL